MRARLAIALLAMIARTAGALPANVQSPVDPTATAATENSSVVSPSKRLALVIGNARYGEKSAGAWTGLKSPSSDVAAVTRQLTTLGFEVTALSDVTLQRFNAALVEFRRRLRQSPGALALVYYSGHGAQGAQMRSGNADTFLIPVDASSDEEDELAVEAISLERLLDGVLSGDPLAAVIVLDACRTNAVRRGTKAATKGLGAASPRDNVLIAYAAAPGEVALDGEGPLSPYTRAFVEQLGRPDRFLGTTFKDIRREVVRATQDRQRPEVWDQTEFEILLGASAAAAPPSPPPTPVLNTAESLLGELVAISNAQPGAASGRIATHEVTVAQFRVFTAATGYRTDAERGLTQAGCWVHDASTGRWGWRADANWRAPGFEQSDRDPLVCISYQDARHYMSWLAQRTGQIIRAPSAAEWQAASGSREVSAAEACQKGNVADATLSTAGQTWRNALTCSDARFYTAPVGSYAPTEQGLFDMVGNVREWSSDCAGRERAQTEGCRKHVILGGGFHNGLEAQQPQAVDVAGVAFRAAFLGLRLVVEKP